MKLREFLVAFALTHTCFAAAHPSLPHEEKSTESILAKELEAFDNIHTKFWSGTSLCAQEILEFPDTILDAVELTVDPKDFQKKSRNVTVLYIKHKKNELSEEDKAKIKAAIESGKVKEPVRYLYTLSHFPTTDPQFVRGLTQISTFGPAAYNLSRLYDNSNQTSLSTKYAHLHQAADQGIVEAKEELCRYLFQQRSPITAPDHELISKYAQELADANNLLGLRVHAKNLSSTDVEKAIDYAFRGYTIESKMQLESRPATALLGEIYEKKGNLLRALRYYSEAKCPTKIDEIRRKILTHHHRGAFS